MSRVVITGVGVVSACDAGFAPFRAALASGEFPFVEVDRTEGHHRGTASRAHLVPAGETRAWIAPMKSRRMSPPSRFAVAASRMALADAGLAKAEPTSKLEGPASERVGVSLGTAFGSTTITKKILDQCVDPGPEAISPFLFTESVANAHAGQVGLELELRGPNATVTQGEASPFLAVARGADFIEAGRADVVLAGGVDEVSPLLHAILDRMGALASDVGFGERALPFDRRRTGFELSEGAVVLALESEAHAQARGARILASLTARGRAFDPTAPPGGWGTGAAALSRRASTALERTGIAASSIGAVASTASGARACDALEARVLGELFGRALPPVLVPKATCGEFGGMALGAALHAALGGEIAAQAAAFEPGEGIDLAPSTRAANTHVLATSLASSGPAAWLCLEGAVHG